MLIFELSNRSTASSRMQFLAFVASSLVSSNATTTNNAEPTPTQTTELQVTTPFFVELLDMSFRV